MYTVVVHMYLILEQSNSVSSMDVCSVEGAGKKHRSVSKFETSDFKNSLNFYVMVCNENKTNYKMQEVYAI